MSTAVFFNLPAHGHVNPTLPVVAELVRRGERIVYYASEPFRQKVEQTGATFRSYGSAYDFEPSRNLGGPFALMAFSMQATEEMMPRLLEALASDKPDYLLLDSMSVWGNLIQQSSALPAVCSCSTFALSRELMGEMRGSQRPPLAMFLKGIPHLLRYFQIARRLDRRYGTRSPGVADFFLNRQALNLVYTSREFQPRGDRFDESYKFVGPSVAPRREATDFPFEQVGDQPLIYISMGTIFNDVADFYRACFRAFADSPYRVVMSIGKNVDAAALGTPPANFIVRPYVPQLDILQRAVLFVTHGGMNSASESLLEHVPMLVVPQQGDQYFVANRVAQLGVGLSLDAAAATSARLRALAEQLLADPAARRRCAILGDSLRAAGGYQRAADEIFAFKQRVGIA